MKGALCGSVLFLLLLPGAAAFADSPVTLSPGGVDRVVAVSRPCPTFSWTPADGARVVELVVYRMPQRQEVEARSVIEVELPGSAQSWTPSVDLCLEPGARYAWSVRGKAGQRRSDWSEPRLFEILPAPTQEELRWALARIEAHLGGAGETAGSDASASVDTAAVTNRLQSANVAPTLKRGAPEEAGAATAPPEPAMSAVPFVVNDDGSVTAGSLTASSLDCPGCVDSADIQDGSVTGTDIAQSTIEGRNVANNTITGDKIAADAIAGFNIVDNTISDLQIDSGAVGSSEIAEGAVGASEIADGAVGSSEIADGAVGSTHIAVDAVQGSELAGLRVVSVECNGSCSETTLDMACGSGFEAIAVDCENIDDDAGVACGGNNVCQRTQVQDSDTLDEYCADADGFDAQVYCLPD